MPADKNDELLKVLDENGNETGLTKPRGVVHSITNPLRHNEVSLWVIDREKQTVLVERRHPDKDFGKGKLGLCAGHVGGDQTIEEALFAEASEEIGLDLKNYIITPIARIRRDEPKNHCFSHHFFVLENKPANEYKVQQEELTEVLYIPYETFKRMILTGSDEVAYDSTKGEWNKLFDQLDKIMIGLTKSDDVKPK